MRIDVYLCENGFCESRNKAKYLVESGYVTADGKTVKKVSESADGKDIKLTGEMKYVGRGAFKLEAAINGFHLDVKNKKCVDIGASTGGFTDCLLQKGADKVYCIDSGYGQLHTKIAHDKRVVNIEGFNARELDDTITEGKVDIAVMDVSFISQTLLYDGVNRVLTDNGIFVSLIKPQFENDPSSVGKGGIVKNKIYHERAINKIIAHSTSCGLYLQDIIPSPIKGGDGNTEYLALFKKEKCDIKIDVKKIVSETFA